jgi:hypothetical protein
LLVASEAGGGRAGLDRNQTPMIVSKMKQPNDEVGMNGQIGLPKK